MARILTENLDGSRMRCPRCNSVKVENMLETFVGGISGGTQTSQSLVVRRSLTHAPSVSLVTRTTDTPVRYTAKAEAVRPAMLREAPKIEEARLWIVGLMVIPGFFMVVLALKGSVLPLVLLAALAAAVYLGMAPAITAARVRDCFHDAPDERWRNSMRCWHCNLTFYHPGAAFQHPENLRLLDEQAGQYAHWAAEGAEMRVKGPDLPWHGAFGDGSSAHQQALQAGVPLPVHHPSQLSAQERRQSQTPQQAQAAAVFGAVPGPDLRVVDVDKYPWRVLTYGRLAREHLEQFGRGQEAVWRVTLPGQLWRWDGSGWTWLGRTEDMVSLLQVSGVKGLRAAYATELDGSPGVSLVIEIDALGRLVGV